SRRNPSSTSRTAKRHAGSTTWRASTGQSFRQADAVHSNFCCCVEVIDRPRVVDARARQIETTARSRSPLLGEWRNLNSGNSLREGKVSAPEPVHRQLHRTSTPNY